MTSEAPPRARGGGILPAAVGVLLLAAAAQVHATWRERDPGAASAANARYARVVPGAIAASKPGDAAAPRESKASERPAPAPMTASGPARGQAGYVHYFLVRKPDGTSEMQVGLELEDRTIAWSFPGVGVAVSPFIESGAVEAKGGKYEVQHLFGIRPFPDDAAMAQLAHDMPARIAPWIDAGVQHCDIDPPRRGVCVSCLGFVLRVLFPGNFPAQAALPAELQQARAGERYTTEDLLLYLTGLHRVETREARLGLISELSVPESLREELIRLVETDAAVPAAVPSATRSRRGGKNKALRPPVNRPRS